MLPTQYIAFGEKSKEGYFSFVPYQNDKGPSIKIEKAPLGRKVFSVLPFMAKMLADQDNNLIIDEVLLDKESLKSYKNSLKDHTVYFINVRCDLKEMQEREILRGDRAIGLSNGQIDQALVSIEYDLIVDTTETSPFTIGQSVLNFIKATEQPPAFRKIEE